MTAWRTNNRGTLMIDRVITGIGRIQRASGTHSPSEVKEINALITRYRRLMLQPGADPIYRAALAALHSGEISGTRLLEADLAGRVRDLVLMQPRPLTVSEQRAAEPVREAWERWNEKTPNHKTKRARGHTLARILELKPDATVGDLPDVLLLMAERYAEQAPAFNRARAAMMRFVRTRLTKVHPIYDALSAVEAMVETPIQRDAPSLELAIAFRDVLEPKAAALWWSMYLTGMNPTEYDGVWELDGGAIHIRGTKRDARDRWVPHLGPVVRRTMGWKQYRAALNEGVERLPAEMRPAQGWKPNDARRGYRALLESVRFAEPRIRLYMGHSLDVSQRYGKPERMTAIREDTPVLMARIDEAERAAREARKSQWKVG